MSDPALTHTDRRTGRRITNDFLKSSIEKSESRLRRLRVPTTSSKIIADQAFGFWTDLFEVHHYRLLLGRPIQIFSHLPSAHGRSEVCERLNTIRQFRNRINHNEPVCFNGATADFRYVNRVYCAIVDIFRWIDPQLLQWTKDIDNVGEKIERAQLLLNNSTR